MTNLLLVSAAPTANSRFGAAVGDYIALMKPRVMSLVVFTGFVGVYLPAGQLHPVAQLITVLCIALGAGAAGAINMWYDRDIDRLMLRTRSRPLPAGRLAPGDALVFGSSLAVASVAAMGFSVNWLAAAVLALTIAFYIFIYTIWLKRRTPQNIVIGGAAGALPPVVGWAAATGNIGLPALLMFALIFFWTPPHFWALSLYRTDDYVRAGVPMLPVVAGKRATKRQILAYTIALWPVSLGPALIGIAGWLYAGAALTLSALFTLMAVRVCRDDGDSGAKRMFGFSILYLFLLFTLLVIDRAPGAWS